MAGRRHGVQQPSLTVSSEPRQAGTDAWSRYELKPDPGFSARTVSMSITARSRGCINRDCGHTAWMGISPPAHCSSNGTNLPSCNAFATSQVGICMTPHPARPAANIASPSLNSWRALISCLSTRCSDTRRSHAGFCLPRGPVMQSL